MFENDEGTAQSGAVSMVQMKERNSSAARGKLHGFSEACGY